MRKMLGLAAVTLAAGWACGFTVGFVDDCGSDATAVGQNYLNAVMAQGATATTIAWTTDTNAIAQAVAAVDLVFLQGGEDIDPARYGAERSAQCGTVNTKRDAFEFAVLDAARAANKPIFGVCRGVQMINVYFGGTLYQDLATEVGAAHASRHNIQLASDGFLKPIFRSAIQSVNSTHHQAVKQLAPGFTVAATAPDGVTEAIENKALNVRGVQFHPESLQATEEPFQRLFKWLITGELPPEVAPAGAGTLVAKWDFRNYDPANPKSTNVLASALAGGSPAIPCYYKGAGTAAIDDLGEMYVVDYQSTECPGLNKGEYGLAIPMYSHLKLTTPDAIKNHAWSMRIKFYRPATGATRACLFSNKLANNGDGSLFIQGAIPAFLGCSTGIFTKSGGGCEVGGFRWHELVINADANGNELFLDGVRAAASTGDSSAFFNNGGILLSADNSGEDTLLFFSEVALYDGYTSPTKTVAENVTLTADADWRADGTVELGVGSTLDLAGHHLAVSSVRTAEVQPVARWNFSAYTSASPTNALLSALPGGTAAIPCTNVVASGSKRGTAPITNGTLGKMSVSATGRYPGEYQLTVPQGSHLKLPTPASVKNHAWAMAIVFRDANTKVQKAVKTFFSRDLSNTSDGALFIQASSLKLGCSSGLFKPYGSTQVTTSPMVQEILLVGGSWGNKAYVNGVLAHSTTTDSSGMFNQGAILLCGDNDGEDNELTILDVRIYDTDQVVSAYSTGAVGGSRGFATITDSVGGGELHLDVARGEDFGNYGVQFAGGLKVVKEGDGLYADYTAHSHTGGTYIASGSYRIEQNTTPFGAKGGTVTVANGAVLDMLGQEDLTAYTYEFGGGILANAFSLGTGSAQIADVRLTADSTFNLRGHYGLIGADYAPTKLDLAGHNLDVFTLRGMAFYIVNATATAGKLTFHPDGICVWGVEGHGTNDFGAVTVENFSMSNNIYTPTTVGTWIARNINGGADGGTIPVVVTNRLVIGDFTNGTSKVHTTLLTDGATLDLSELNEAWIPISKFASVTDYVTFAEGAKIDVDLGTRNPRALVDADDPYVVKWGDATVPSETTQFNLANEVVGLKLSRNATGLKVIRCDTLIILR